jgi:DNA repair exonuclease SbcCD ATPase subunit
MKQKTPQSVLEMLQEIKSLSDQDKFYSSKFLINYPSFYQYRGILIRKGLFEKKLGREKWIGIEPNLVMAKAIIKLKIEHSRQLKEKRSIKKDELFDGHQDNVNFMGYLPYKFVGGKEIVISDENEDTAFLVNSENMKELIDSNSSLKKQLEDLNKKYLSEESKWLKLEKNEKDYENRLNVKEQEIKILNQKIKELNSVVYEKNDSVKHYVKANAILENKIIENEELISNYRTKAEVKTKHLKEKEKLIVDINELVNSKNEKILELNQLIANQLEENKALKETESVINTITSTGSVKKIVKIFGIPIFSSETK